MKSIYLNMTDELRDTLIQRHRQRVRRTLAIYTALYYALYLAVLFVGALWLTQ